jgi:hypothetical protein
MQHDTEQLEVHEELTDDDRIRKLVKRLSRPNASGGATIERAAIMASGTDSAAMLAWVVSHAGEAEEQAPVKAGFGLHSARLSARASSERRNPLRYVLPPGTLS